MKKLFLGLFPLSLLMGVLLSFAVAQAYVIGVDDCGGFEGVSYPTAMSPFRIDFDKKNWYLDPLASPMANIAAERASGIPILENSRTCFDEVGDHTYVSPTEHHRFAWYTGIDVLGAVGGLVNFAWYEDAMCTNPLHPLYDVDFCANERPTIAEGPHYSQVYADFVGNPSQGWWDNANYYYWEGYAYGGSDLGWLNFGWDCPVSTGAFCIPYLKSSRVRTDRVTGEVSGYAYSELTGQLVQMGNQTEPALTVIQDLPSVPPDLELQPDISLNPIRHEAGGTTPLADGVDSYELEIQLLDVNGVLGTVGGPWAPQGIYSGYTVGVEVVSTIGSQVYVDQVARVGDAIFYDPSATYVEGHVGDLSDDTFVYNIYSWAPTSNANGYDEDNDGEIDYYFDRSPSDPSGFTRSDSANAFEIADINITVTGSGSVGVDNYLCGIACDDEIWNLDVSEMELAFAPAVEVKDLVYPDPDTPDDEIYLPSILNRLLVLTANVKAWSYGAGWGDTDVDVQLNSSDYYFLFDSTGEGDYVPLGLDEATDTTRFSGLITGDELSLGAGWAGSGILSVMLVDSGGYYTFVEEVIEKVAPSFFAKLMAFLNPFEMLGVPAAKAFCPFQPCDPPLDLDITSITSSNADDRITINIPMAGCGISFPDQDPDYEGAIPTLYVKATDIYSGDIQEFRYGDGTYNDPDPGEGMHIIQHNLNDEVDYPDEDFLDCGSTSIDIYGIGLDSSAFDLYASIDTRDEITETNEDNNTITRSNVGTTLPDIEVTDVYLNDDNYIVAEIVNNTDEPLDTSIIGQCNPFEVGSMSFPCIRVTVDGVFSAYHIDSGDTSLDFEDGGGSLVLNTQDLPSIFPDPVSTGTHSVMVHVYTGNDELDDANNELTVSVEVETAEIAVDADMLYETIVNYSVPSLVDDVSYYSAYLSLTDASGIEYNVPDWAGKEDATITGSVTSQTEDQIGVGSFSFVGDVSTTSIRNEIYERVVQLTRGVAAPGGGRVSWNGSLRFVHGTSLLDNTVHYYTDDVGVYNLPADQYDQHTIIVEGGDVYIEDNIEGGAAIGLVVLEDENGNGGNVYVVSDVTDIVDVNIYADGSVLSSDSGLGGQYLLETSYDGMANELMTWADDDERACSLTNQLYFSGSIVSKNTIGGANADVFPDGSATNDHVGISSLAVQEYDFNDLRDFTLCWVQTDNGVAQDVTGDFVVDINDMQDCQDAVVGVCGHTVSYLNYNRSENLVQPVDVGGVLSNADNEPFYLEYVPAPPSLPVLGETQFSSFTMF